ncbi:SRPBCC domain-containing protein [Kitasatospora sp. NPDC089509]|uniref:SRPBCC family protein n=1 Tax=Kitasatospora sp. NPDC089509 TaxID=3364079 RepID=UPI00380F1BE3
MTEKATIHCDEFLPYPPARVWEALTDPELHARWWAAGDVKAVVGHRFTLDMGPFGQQPCEVVEVEVEQLLRYSFAAGTLDTTVTWRLVPEGHGTRLLLEHAGFDLDTPMGRQAHHGMAQGWPSVLRRIAPALAE